MCTRANALLAALLAAALLATDDSIELPVGSSPALKHVHPRPTTWREMSIKSYEQPIAGDRMATLRFDPDLPTTTAYTVERVVEGDPSRVIAYVPWVHDHPSAPPMLEAYLVSLIEVFMLLSTTAIVVGIEGSSVGENLHEEFLEIAEALELCDASDLVRSTEDDALCDDLAAFQAEMYASGTERVLSTFAMAATVPIVGVDDTTLIASESDDHMRDRLRSETAVHNVLNELDARGGGRAVLLFGMAHHHDIEEAARRAGATLDLVCMPHLCRAATP